MAKKNGKAVVAQAAAGVDFTALDALPNLQAQTYKKGDRAGVRKTGSGVNDEITGKMAELVKPSEIAGFAHEFTIPAERIVELAGKAPNFGQFRMLMGNLARGVLGRYNKAQADPALKDKIELTDCSTRDTFEKKVRELKPRPAAAPKPDKAVKPAEVPATGDVVAPGGAPTKEQAAKKGKGKKSKPEPVAAADGGDADEGAVAAGAAADGHFE